MLVTGDPGTGRGFGGGCAAGLLITVPTMDFSERRDDETVQDAVVLLQDLVLWEMSPQRWERVDELLQRINDAYAARDATELRAATAELEISGPVRILRIGSKQSTGIPPMTLERRNTLIHSLSSPATGSSATTPEDDRGRQ